MSEVPANLQPYVDVLGPDDAVEFLLAFGGSPVYLAAQPTARSAVVRLVGKEKAVRLAKRVGPGHVLVPICKEWLAGQLKQGGMSVVGIARKLHIHASTVRRYFADDDKRQLSFFE